MKIIVITSIIVIIYFPFTIISDNLKIFKFIFDLHFFDYAWEQRKLNSIFETVSKKGFSNLPVLTATQTKGMIYRNNSGIDIKFNENTLNNYKLVEPNQFVVHLRSFQGGLAASSLRGIASPAYTVLSFKDNKQEVSFWKEFFRSKKFINSLVKVTYGIRDGRTIKVSDLLDLNYRIPAQNLEQCKVGHLISSINKLLTLYENKRKLLTALSRGLSQYLFNFLKEKNTIQMSLSSITLSEAKGIAKENTLSSGNIEYLDTTRLNGGKAKLVSGKKDVDFQDIIVLWDGSNAGKIYYGFSGILGSTLKVFKLKDDINSEYVYHYLKFKQSLILHKFRTPNIPHVSKDFSQRFNLPIPDKEKQNLIANILHLNGLQINLINKKIKELKQIKKSLLQNMFL